MEAGVLRCPGCGAPAAPDAPQCPYCRAQLATVACPACLALAPLDAGHCPGCGAALAPRKPPASAGRPCPACSEPLVASRVGDLDLGDCRACGGLWLDREVFEQLGVVRERQGAMLGALPAPTAPPVLRLEPVQYRPCPICRQRMNRVNYARRSGVVLDVCKPHGLWFDRDELRRVLAFIAGGGLDRARSRELQALEEARRAAARVPLSPDSLRSLGSSGGASGGWLDAGDLALLVLEAAGLLADGA